MFENYQFDGVYIAIQAVLTLYAQGNIYFVVLLESYFGLVVTYWILCMAGSLEVYTLYLVCRIAGVRHEIHA